jgi:hypothetical protein
MLLPGVPAHLRKQAVRGDVHGHDGGLRHRALRLHGVLEAGLVHLHAALGSNFLRDLKREAKSVVQHESLRTG